MKSKFAVLAVFILLSALFQDTNGQLNEKKIELSPFSSLVVKSDLRVVLVESEKIDTARIEGNKKFLESVMIFQAGEELIVRSKSFKDLRNEGTVYIPVQNLKTLEVNSDAKIISYTIIKSPELKLLVNGNCSVSLVMLGKLKIREADGYRANLYNVHHQSNTPIFLGSIYNK